MDLALGTVSDLWWLRMEILLGINDFLWTVSDAETADKVFGVIIHAWETHPFIALCQQSSHDT